MATTERDILEAVASGQMTPAEAARRLEEARDEGEDRPPGGPAGGDEAGQAGADPGRSAGPEAGFRVRISATARSVRVVGDPTVAEAAVEGTHRAHRDGNTLVIDGSVDTDDLGGGFTFEGYRPGWHRPWGPLANWRRFETLVVRVNPSCPVDADVSAGSLAIVGVMGPLRVVLAAGSARVDGVGSPFDIETRAGSIRVRGQLRIGDSRIRCEAGSVKLHLSPGSDVRVRARTDLGRVRVHGIPGTSGAGAFGPFSADNLLSGQREVTIGAGTASLDVETAMGSVDIHSEDLAATAWSRW